MVDYTNLEEVELVEGRIEASNSYRINMFLIGYLEIQTLNLVIEGVYIYFIYLYMHTILNLGLRLLNIQLRLWKILGFVTITVHVVLTFIKSVPKIKL